MLPLQEVRDLLSRAVVLAMWQIVKISRLIAAGTWRAHQGPFLACVWRFRKPENS